MGRRNEGNNGEGKNSAIFSDPLPWCVWGGGHKSGDSVCVSYLESIWMIQKTSVMAFQMLEILSSKRENN